MNKKSVQPPRHYRWLVVGRLLAATVGGYAVAALVSAMLALLLARLSITSAANAVLATTLLSFVFYTGVAIWVFSCRSDRRMWLQLLLTTGAFTAALLGLQGAA